MNMVSRGEKKRVIAYLHSHWDREWYREFEVFRLRLIRVFDNVLDMLSRGTIPSFYFDGQVSALLDYLEFRPDKEQLIKELVVDKKLFIGPFYTLVDEFLTDGICFRKNLDIGLSIAKYFGCEDFIAYFADTFGHSQNIPKILKEYDIDKAIVWRGVPDSLPAEFIFNGVNTVNLVRGYFMDIFAGDKTIEEKAEFLKKNLDMIAEKSGDYLLLPIGADHLGIPIDIADQIAEVNNYLDDYEIVLSNPFEYFESVKFKERFNNELRDNSATFILPGCYSARLKLKQLNTECSYKLNLADKIQYNFGGDYSAAIDYAYKLLLQNQAHDSICGCSTDDVHEENIVRYKKILQIANTVIEESKFAQEENMVASFKYQDKHKILEVIRTEITPKDQVIETFQGVPQRLLCDTLKIPVTEDYRTMYRVLKEFKPDNLPSDLHVSDNTLENSNIKLEIVDGKINLSFGRFVFNDFIKFVRYKDQGDTYNYAPDPYDAGEVAQIRSAHVIMDGPLRCALKIDTTFFSVIVYLNKKSKLLNFKINWSNLLTNRLWQVCFNLDRQIRETMSEDLNELVKRKFDPAYNMRENLPKVKGKEAKTNTAPMQRFVWCDGFGVITKGLTEYEVYRNTLSITLLRSIGIISNPKNPARTTPAGPPIRVAGAQQLGLNSAEFSIGFFDIKDWASYVEEVYPETIIF